MVWVRGAAADFDDGAAEGNSGWSYRDCLPFFKAIEDNEAGEDAWRGQGGAMRVTGPLPGFSPGLSNCRPTSRGSILARAADPSIAPRIAPNALATSEDVEACLEGVKLLRRLAAQPALSEVVEAELAPGPDVGADAELIQDFRMRAGTVYHPVGTCRMAPNGERGAVDARLRVYGVEGLRVADASVFPTIASSNINAAVMMVAAKTASLILEDARRRR